MGRKIKILRQARTITVRGGDEVYTRFSKREYEVRRDIFDDPDYQSRPPHLANYSYDEWVDWGNKGGRPKKWANEAEGKRAQRAQKKLSQGQIPTCQEKELLGLIKKRPGAYKSGLGRKMNPKERQRARRARLKEVKSM